MQSGTRELASFVTWSRRHYTGGTGPKSLLLGRSAHQDASVSRFVLGAGRGSRDGEFEGSREVDMRKSAGPIFVMWVSRFEETVCPWEEPAQANG